MRSSRSRGSRARLASGIPRQARLVVGLYERNLGNVRCRGSLEDVELDPTSRVRGDLRERGGRGGT